MHTKDSRSYQAYAVVTLCRALYTYLYGVPVSKKQAAHWAREQLPQWSLLIQNSLDWQKSNSNERIDCLENYALVEEFVKDIIKRVSTTVAVTK